MLSKIKVLLWGACLFVFIGGFFVSSCTQYASQEELRRLEEQCKAARAAEQKVQDLEKDKADLERRVKEKQAVVDKLTKDRDAVKE